MPASRGENSIDKVTGRSKDIDGNVIVNYNDNTFLNTMVYYVKFTYGVIKEYTANIIVGNIYTQVDP